MRTLQLKPTHKAVETYYPSLAQFEALGVTHESAVRAAFQGLLEACARQFDWTLVLEYPLPRRAARPLKADGAVLRDFGLVQGHWEAKDTADDLEQEIKHKFAAGYPRENMLFQEPRRAVLYQDGKLACRADLTQPEDLVHVLKLFFEFQIPEIEQWEEASERFRGKVPELGAGLRRLLHSERQTNPAFRAAFASFHDLCRASLNPNLSEAAVEEMIIQHLLTERLFRRIFNLPDFVQRNVIAQEIERVIVALTHKVFSRDDFLQSLDHFYKAIENAATTLRDFSEKQTFLNTVYERFFQGFSVQVADTHGIVYTPQPLVDFMVASVEQVLREEFGKSLADRDVQILDPFTGTGNFIVNLIRHLAATRKAALPHKFARELFCNEVMLLPYYIASMNIEHAYLEETGQYAPFEGICLVDTFETINGRLSYFAGQERHEQQEMVAFSQANTERINRQKAAPIRVILANPPYNAGQVNENDNNKNRKYPELDRRVSVTYGADSEATLLRKLSDPYVKAIRFATDRIGDQGIVCYVCNSSFIAEKSFDGMRKHLAQDFDLIYVLDLGGNVRKNPKLSGTTHNVFGIQVGVSINLFVKRPRASASARKPARILHHAVPVPWRKEEKYRFLETARSVAGVSWKTLKPDRRHNWLTHKSDAEFARFLPLGSKEAKAGAIVPTIFRTYSLGVSTNRDEVVYGFDAEGVAKRVERFVDDYSAELHRWRRKGKPADLDNFVSYERVKWSRDLKLKLAREVELEFHPDAIRDSLYRPFTRMKLYAAAPVVDRPGPVELFPTARSLRENRVILAPSAGGRSPFWCGCATCPPNLNFVSIDSAQCFPIFSYAAGGASRRENVTTQAVVRFKNHFDDDAITRRDIFHYGYALLHHPAYRACYAENLKRELPRIPLPAAGVVSAPLDGTPNTGDKRTAREIKADRETFRAFAAAGRRLVELHADYEQQPEFPLRRVENRQAPLDWRVEAMRLSKDRASIFYNDFLTLADIPPEVFDYRLGNRSALEWVIDQYRVSRDERGGLVSDPNRADDEQYIVRLLGQVVYVSVETLKLVRGLPELKFP